MTTIIWRFRAEDWSVVMAFLSLWKPLQWLYLIYKQMFQCIILPIKRCSVMKARGKAHHCAWVWSCTCIFVTACSLYVELQDWHMREPRVVQTPRVVDSLTWSIRTTVSNLQEIQLKSHWRPCELRKAVSRVSLSTVYCVLKPQT